MWYPSDTYIIAFCPDTDSWFITRDRAFFYEYEKEFETEEEAIEFMKVNKDWFLNKDHEIMLSCGQPNQCWRSEVDIYLENTEEWI